MKHRAYTLWWLKKALRRFSSTAPQSKRKQHLARRRHRYRTEPAYRTKCLIRSRVYTAMKGLTKSTRTLKLLGCSIEHAHRHLEMQFEEGMTFKKRGDWHIDHIVPIAHFNLADPEHQRRCFHYTNLQPLWAQDNLRKSASYDGSRVWRKGLGWMDTDPTFPKAMPVRHSGRPTE